MITIANSTKTTIEYLADIEKLTDNQAQAVMDAVALDYAYDISVWRARWSVFAKCPTSAPAKQFLKKCILACIKKDEDRALKGEATYGIPFLGIKGKMFKNSMNYVQAILG